VGTAVFKSEGAEHSSVGLTGTGDLVRDSTGARVAGFTYMIGTCSSTRAEHLGLFKGLNLVWNLGRLRKIILEVDSKSVAELIEKGCDESKPNASIVHSIRYMLAREWPVRVQYKKKGGNGRE
jgi:ribonuclease HI